MKPAVKTMCRLTLAQPALVLAMTKSSPLAGEMHLKRPDGKWDVGVSFGIFKNLQESALPKENLSDTVLRILSKPVSEQ